MSSTPSRPTAPPPVLSPHLQIWRWTITMAASILQRATGIALYGGTVLLAFWLASAALGPNTFAGMQALFGSWIGKIILFGYSWAISFHMLNGIKYLAADAGKGLGKEVINRNAWIVFIGSAVLTAIIWAAGLSLGGA